MFIQVCTQHLLTFPFAQKYKSPYQRQEWMLEQPPETLWDAVSKKNKFGEFKVGLVYQSLLILSVDSVSVDSWLYW